MRAGGVMMSVPSFGSLDVEFVTRYYGMGLPVNASVCRAYPCGLPVAEARNMSVQGAIERDCEYIFFLDYDVLVPRDALTRLVGRGTEMVGGLYFTKAKPPWPLVLVGGHSTMDWTPGDLVKADATGMGCMLLRVDLLKKLDPPWFDTGASVTEGGREWHTEDTYFFNRVNDELGLSPYVDTAVSCIHKDLLTNERFFLGPENGLPTWAEPDGTKHAIPPVGHAECSVRDLTQKESEEKHEETCSVAVDGGADCDSCAGACGPDDCN